MSGLTGTAAHLLSIANSPQAAYVPPGYDYRSAPLGSMPGEEGLTVPYNASGEAIVSVRNWSALLKRRVLIEAVSPQRGGYKSCNTKGSPFFGKTPEELRRRVKEEGDDMNWYEMKVEPVTFGLRFDGIIYPIKAETEEVEFKNQETGEYERKKQPKWHHIPPGAWDLYMGNFERMNAPDFMVRTREMEAVNGRGLTRFVISGDNPEGFLEFRREEIKVVPQAVDRSQITASEMIEV